MNEGSTVFVGKVNDNFEELSGGTSYDVTGEENAPSLITKLNTAFSALADGASVVEITGDMHSQSFVNSLNDNFEDLFAAQDEPSESVSLTFGRKYCTYAGRYIKSDGTDAAHVVNQVSIRGFACSDYILIPDGATLKYTCDYADSTYGRYAFYNTGKTYISGGFVSVGSNIAVTIPSGAKYLRFTNRTRPYSNVSFTFTASGAYASALATRKQQDTDAPLRKSCHVFTLGNSYTGDQFFYATTYSDAYGIDTKTCSMTKVENGPFKLQDWAMCVDGVSGVSDTGKNSSTPPALDSTFSVGTGFGTGFGTKETVTELLSEPWDIIYFQQRSDASNNYDKTSVYLGILIDKVREVCPNPDVKIYYDMTQGRASSSSSINYANIVNVTQRLMQDYSEELEAVIPVGTAIENLRLSSLNTGDLNQFTRDGSHLANCAGKYVAGLTLFMSLFSNMISGSIYSDTTTTIAVATDGNYGTTGQLAVTNDNRLMMQRCVANALEKPLETDVPT